MSVLPLPEPERLLRAVLNDARDDGRGMRATWHLDAGLVVLSVWRGPSCVATTRLAPAEAARLAALLTGGLGTLAEEAAHSGAAADADRRTRADTVVLPRRDHGEAS